MSNVLAIDIGGTKVAVGLVDSLGRLTNKDQIQSQNPEEGPLYDRILALARKCLAGLPPEIDAIGVGC